MLPLVQDKATDTLATVGGISISDVNCSLTSGAFKDPVTGTAPSYKIVVVFDPANPTYPTRYEQVRMTVSGTTVTQMERNFGGINPLGPQLHSQGCEVRLVTPGDYLNNLITHSETGLTKLPSFIASTYASASTFTLAGDWTTILSTGDEVVLTNVTTKRFQILSTSVASSITTVTVLVNTDFALVAGAITNVSYRKATSSAFPSGFAIAAPTYAGSGAMTITTVTTPEFRGKIIGNRFVGDISFSGTVGGTLSNTIYINLPVARKGTTANKAAGYGNVNNVAFETATVFWNGTSQTQAAINRPTGTNFGAGSLIANLHLDYEIL